MKIRHTPGDWHWTLRHSQAIVISGDAHGENTCLATVLTSWDDASLMASSPHAPHECGVPRCPGNLNRQRLEMFEELMRACINLVKATYGQEIPNALRDAEVAIAKAKGRAE